MNADPTKFGVVEGVSYLPRGVSLGLFKYGDGREDKSFTGNFGLATLFTFGEHFPMNVVMPVTGAGPPMWELYEFSCRVGDDAESDVKVTRGWVPLMTQDGVAQRYDLLAQVIAQLPRPEMVFIDQDLDFGWLWVRVPHHVGVSDIDPVRVSATDTDSSGWAPVSSVTVWIEANPTSFEVRMQDEAGEQELGSCDLATAMSEEGCLIRFTHASAISDDERFHGLATVEWTLTSNAGSFDGLGPFVSNGEFEVQVAEAMAVTRSE